MRSRRTLVLVVVLLVIAGVGAWQWMAWSSAGKPDDASVDKAAQLEAAYQEAGGKGVDQQQRQEQLEDDAPAEGESVRGPVTPDD